MSLYDEIMYLNPELHDKHSNNYIMGYCRARKEASRLALKADQEISSLRAEIRRLSKEEDSQIYSRTALEVAAGLAAGSQEKAISILRKFRESKTCCCCKRVK